MKRSERGKGRESLTPDEIRECDKFKRMRSSCGMSQEEWAREISVSASLVKKIESHARPCSAKTMESARRFMKGSFFYLDGPCLKKLDGLEGRILYDILLSRMESGLKGDSRDSAFWCAESIQKMLENAGRLESPDARGAYFKFLGCLLSAAGIAAGEAADSLQGVPEPRDGEKAPDAYGLLNSQKRLEGIFKNGLLKKFLKSGDVYPSDGSIHYQRGLF